MNSTAADPGERTAPQIKTVRVVGIRNMEQALYGLFTQEINGRGSYFVLGRIFSGHRAQAFGERNRNDINEFQHIFHGVV